jgi:fatty acid-binding protein DegV
MAVGILTDSASSVSDADRARLAIDMVLLPISAEGAPVPEHELHDPAFYTRLENMDGLPVTSQPSPEEFVRAFRRVLDRGATSWRC